MTGGLNKIDRKPRIFFTIKKEIDNPNSLSDNSISAICEDKEGNIWFGTFNKGLIKFIPAQKKFIHYYSNPSDSKALNGELIKKIYEDKTGKLWIGTYFSLLNSYDKKNDSFIKYDLEKKGFPEGANNIRTVFEDSEGILWFGINGGGLLKYDRKNNTYFRYSAADSTETNLSNDYVISICEDDENNLWIGTFGGGLNKFNKKNKKFTNYSFDKSNPHSLSENVITDLYIDHSGILWVGTYATGLNKFNKNENSFTRFYEKDGLPSDFICAILEDDHGNLWLSTSKGICKLILQKIFLKTMITATEFKRGNLIPVLLQKQKADGFIFGGVNGVTYFHPDSLKDNPFIPPIVITSVKVNNEETNSGRNPAYLDTLFLSFSDNNFSFEFASLDYTLPEKNIYAYKLEGFKIRVGIDRQQAVCKLHSPRSRRICF